LTDIQEALGMARNIAEYQNKQNHTSFSGGTLQISYQKEETPITTVTETFALKLVRILKRAL
jgi:hypothetical protein